MPAQELWKKWKAHLFFAGGFLLVFIINVAFNFASGQSLLRAMFAALSDIRPMEYAMFVLFWYAVVHGREHEARTHFTTLNLRDSKS